MCKWYCFCFCWFLIGFYWQITVISSYFCAILVRNLSAVVVSCNLSMKTYENPTELGVNHKNLCSTKLWCVKIFTLIIWVVKTLTFLFHVEVKSESNEDFSVKHISKKDIWVKDISIEDISEEDIAIILQLAENINF